MNHVFSYGTGKLAVASLPLLLLCFLHCSRSYHKNGIKEFWLEVNYPILTSKADTIEHLLDTVRVQFHKDTLLYYLPYQQQNFDENGDVVEQRKWYHLLFRKGKDSGYLFLNLSTEAQFVKVAVDSLLIRRAYRNEYQFDPAVVESKNTLLLGDTIVEQYSLHTVQEDELDSMYFSYRKEWSAYPFYLSAYRDSSVSAKLFKVQAVFNEQAAGGYLPSIPRREFVVEFKQQKQVDQFAWRQLRAVLGKHKLSL